MAVGLAAKSGAPRSGGSQGPREIVSDYRDFDFAAIWAGRQQVTAFERGLLAQLLAGADLRRVVEIGTGFGRLSEGVAAVAGEYVGVDYDPKLLATAADRVWTSRGGREGVRFALMNAYHPAFVPGAFTAAVMVRVYHHLSEPAAVLGRWARSLRRRGQLIVSYNPRPSIGTLVIDVKAYLRPTGGARPPTITWSRRPVVEISDGRMHTYAAPRREFERAVAAAGFHAVREVGAGLEEYLARAPTSALLRLSLAWPQGRGFPGRFAVLESGVGPETALPPIDRIWACPSCGLPLGDSGEPSRGPPRCVSCGWVGAITSAGLDYRYLSATPSTPDPDGAGG